MRRHLPDAWPLPGLDDLSRDFFTAGRLVLQRCLECGTVQHPPEEVCYRCQAMRFTGVESAGRGHIYSYVVAHHPVSPLLRERVPYGIALVQLDDFPDVRVLGNVLNLEPEELRIGLPLRVTFEEVQDQESGERLLVPQWEAIA
jgi:uncharacterized OB-fold protein